MKKDKIVQNVVDSFNERSRIGIEKYGTTLEENNKDNYLQHLQEELMDATLYIEKIKNQTIYPLLKVNNLRLKNKVINLDLHNLKQVNLIYNHDGTELTIEID
jgi:hypothetical protein